MDQARSNCMLLAGMPSSVGRARAYARWVLDTWQLSSMVDTVELLVSELVTNAVKATGVVDEPVDEDRLAGTVSTVYLSLSALADTLLVEVWDVSSTPPLRRVASETDETGRGLLLVQALSKEWGCEVLQTGGKIVWCKCLIGEGA
ncbi:ATP-binding protein [Actinomadura sp. DC4]|uniref:ATP-binding protein n=1 Tax=Actinomadura sp. DC4 TaxID=3055069 RepID=UPI0025B00FB3|nr:ATP-binding protein [Actinomadura sp. DC4]MDN3355883.1 ATP-binding protein [Actinomadura sp. DC4]